MTIYPSKNNKFTLRAEEPVLKEAEQLQVRGSVYADEYARKVYAWNNDDITIYESFYILLLNNSNKTVGYAKISQGGLTGTLVDVRLVAKYALESLATSIILVHNHPSGTLKPSESDKSLTEKVKKGLKNLDITVLDHLILTEKSYFSFADEGIL